MIQYDSGIDSLYIHYISLYSLDIITTWGQGWSGIFCDQSRVLQVLQAHHPDNGDLYDLRTLITWQIPRQTSYNQLEVSATCEKHV